MTDKVNPKDPFGPRRPLTPSQRVIARNTHDGIAAIDRINARVASDVGAVVRDLGNRPIEEHEANNIMAQVDLILGGAFGGHPNETLESPIGTAILRQCRDTGLGVHDIEIEKVVDRYMDVIERNPEFGREVLRFIGGKSSNT